MLQFGTLRAKHMNAKSGFLIIMTAVLKFATVSWFVRGVQGEGEGEGSRSAPKAHGGPVRAALAVRPVRQKEKAVGSHVATEARTKRRRTHPRAISKLLMSFLIFQISTLRSAEVSSLDMAPPQRPPPTAPPVKWPRIDASFASLDKALTVDS